MATCCRAPSSSFLKHHPRSSLSLLMICIRVYSVIHLKYFISNTFNLDKLGTTHFWTACLETSAPPTISFRSRQHEKLFILDEKPKCAGCHHVLLVDTISKQPLQKRSVEHPDLYILRAIQLTPNHRPRCCLTS